MLGFLIHIRGENLEFLDVDHFCAPLVTAFLCYDLPLYEKSEVVLLFSVIFLIKRPPTVVPGFRQVVTATTAKKPNKRKMLVKEGMMMVVALGWSWEVREGRAKNKNFIFAIRFFRKNDIGVISRTLVVKSLKVNHTIIIIYVRIPQNNGNWAVINTWKKRKNRLLMLKLENEIIKTIKWLVFNFCRAVSAEGRHDLSSVPRWIKIRH